MNSEGNLDDSLFILLSFDCNGYSFDESSSKSQERGEMLSVLFFKGT